MRRRWAGRRWRRFSAGWRREQRGALPGVPGVLPHEQAAAARGVGQERPVLLPAGAEAEAFKRDIRDADVRFVDAGHFALETHVEEIAAAIGEFLTR